MKTIATLLGAAALAATSAAALAQGGQTGASDRQGPRREPMSRAEMESLVDARIAAIQAGLKLTAEQQRHWPAVEQAIRAASAERITRIEERREARARSAQPDASRPSERPDFMARLQRRSDWVSARAERMKTLTEAVKPLWASLDDRQKRLLPVLMRPAAGLGERRLAWREGRMGHHGMMERHGMMGHHGMGHHHRRMGRGGPEQERGGDAAPRQP
jgi:hypothetical protein